EALTLTLVADFPVPVERLWTAFSEPRQLERFWGPPGYPTTFVDFELNPGARVSYYMTGPEGEKYNGLWDLVEVDENRTIVMNDRFADDNGEPNDEMPAIRMTLVFESTATGSRVTNTSSFESVEALEQSVEMGMVE